MSDNNDFKPLHYRTVSYCDRDVAYLHYDAGCNKIEFHPFDTYRTYELITIEHINKLKNVITDLQVNLYKEKLFNTRQIIIAKFSSIYKLPKQLICKIFSYIPDEHISYGNLYVLKR